MAWMPAYIAVSSLLSNISMVDKQLQQFLTPTSHLACLNDTALKHCSELEKILRRTFDITDPAPLK
jgi:hypothetical protein